MRVIVINGAMGVGKTTVGKILAETHPGTAFIDGDWCMDIHPFVGNPETRAMAADNILHMVRNYLTCSVCTGVVVVWLMDDPAVRGQLLAGLGELGAEVKPVTLLCEEETLVSRWHSDPVSPWRTEEWLAVSLKSLKAFAGMENPLDTENLTAEQVAERIWNLPQRRETP